MEYRLLGLLEVTGAEGPVAIGRGKESALLALLVLHSNRPLSVDRLIDDLWGESPPESAAKSVQVYVSRLRKALGDRVVTTPAGYVLHAEGDDVDVTRFERLVDEARLAEPSRADATLTEALALWRGPALADFRFESFAQDEIRRLEELRNAAVADRVDARLALGRHDEVIPELDELIAAAPLWERPRAQLMLALYRAGRQADALELYRRTRTLFAEELGLEPSAELQSLERQVLNRDPALGAPARRMALPPRRAPLLLLAGGAVLVVAAAAAVVVVSRGDDPASLAGGTPGSVVAIDPKTNRIVANIGVGPGPTAVATSHGSAWVVRAGVPALLEVDARSKRVVARRPLPSIPSDVAVTPDGAWVTSPLVEPGELLHVPPSGPVRRYRVAVNRLDDLFAPRMPSAVAVAPDAVWTNAYTGRLTKVARGVRRSIALGRGRSADGVAYGGGSLWVASSVDDSVLRVDPETGRVVRIPVASVAGRRVVSPLGIAYGYGSAWVTGALDDTVARVDPRVNGVVARIAVGRRPTRVAVGEDAVWVVNAGEGTISRIDPSSNTVASTIRVARTVTGVAAGEGSVWATVAGGAPAVARAPAPVHALPVSLCGKPVQGRGVSDVLVVSDLPARLDGQPFAATADMQTAILRVLRDHRFRAGPYRVAYQACDASAGGSADPARCAELARAYARNGSVVAVIGPYNSDCAKVELPILGTATRGPIAVVSPSNTYVGLTHDGPTTAGDEPDRYFPAGTRNYVRISPPDDGQGAALASFVHERGRSRAFILHDGGPTAVAMSDYVANALRRLGIRVVGRADWGAPSPARFRRVAARVKRARPDAVVLTGCVCTGGPLVGMLRQALGRDVPLIGSDNFTFATDMSETRRLEGVYLTLGGAAAEALPDAGRRFLERAFPGRPRADIGAETVGAADAALVALAAIGASDGTLGASRRRCYGAASTESRGGSRSTRTATRRSSRSASTGSRGALHPRRTAASAGSSSTA